MNRKLLTTITSLAYVFPAWSTNEAFKKSYTLWSHLLLVLLFLFSKMYHFLFKVSNIKIIENISILTTFGYSDHKGIFHKRYGCHAPPLMESKHNVMYQKQANFQKNTKNTSRWTGRPSFINPSNHSQRFNSNKKYRM